MKKKIVTGVMVLLIFLTTTGPIHSNWGPTYDDFGPIVIGGHPWGDNTNTPPPPSPPHNPGIGGGSPRADNVPVITNFVVQFYLKYVVKWMKNGQRPVTFNRKSD